MPAQTADLFLLDDLQDVGRTGQLAESGLQTLRTVAGWFKPFVTRSNKGLGRAEPGCPFVLVVLERKALWLAPEHVANGDIPQVAEPMNGYERRPLGLNLMTVTT